MRDEDKSKTQLIAELNELRARLSDLGASDKRVQEADKRLEAKKLESIGFLAGGVAHDFNNLLSVIMGNIELAEHYLEPDNKVAPFLTKAMDAIMQSKELTRQLITFSTGGKPYRVVGSIGALVAEAALSYSQGSKVKCEFSMPHDLTPVRFDRSQMRRAIKILVENAIESMPDGGVIQIRAKNFQVEPDAVKYNFSFLEGEYIKISIRDQGFGIPEDHLSSVFDPYFSTKVMGSRKGMGLGLATTYSIINRHDGHITVESEVGVGTTFTIYLPTHGEETERAAPVETPRTEDAAPLARKILYMDDEEMVRDVAEHLLHQAGYEVELAVNGAEAIDLYKKAIISETPFDIVVLDLTIRKGMGGKDVVKKILDINPRAKVIVSSGYLTDHAMTDFREYGFIKALPKPYSESELIEALKNAD
ncbi:MAG: response regulator [Desulfobacterales bacterium]|nr:response regulator [Desulfobacterales bacterium]